MSTENPIAHACRLLRETAKELQQAHTRGDRDDWPGEPEAKAAFDEYMAVAGALGALASAAAPAEQPVAPTEKYDDTLLPFLALMRKELHANHDKGDRPGWLKMSADQALLEIYWHTAKLSAAVKNGDGPAIIEHSADVANMAMMLLDVCGGIPTPQAAPSVLEDWRLDRSAGRPILVYKDCSVIEAEQAQEVLDALRASRGQAPAQQDVQWQCGPQASGFTAPQADSVLEDAALSQAARDVLAERQRQINAEGWTPEHDDEHGDRALCMAAVCYVLGRTTLRALEWSPDIMLWPWEKESWKPKDPRQNLIKAGALILAELERIDRAAREQGGAA